MRTRFGEGGGQLDRRRARGVLNPCARESTARTGRFLREKLISDHGLFSSYEGQQVVANGQDSWGFFRDAQGFGRLDAGSPAGFTSSRPPPTWKWVFQFSLFLNYVWPFEKLGLNDQNWLERNLSALLLRTLAVGRRQQSESIGVALDMEEGGLMSRFDIGRCHNFLSRFGSLFV